MRKNGAFTLIELIVYLGLLSFLSLLVFSFASRTYRFMIEQLQAHQVFVRSVVASDLLRRDVQMASPWMQDWVADQKIFKQMTIAAQGVVVDHWIGYEVTPRGLHRREGQFNAVTKKWINSTMTLVDQFVRSLDLQLVINQQLQTVVAVRVKVKSSFEVSMCKQREYVMTIALRSRVLA